MSKQKLCLVGSSGGHLSQLFALSDFWQDYSRFWVTFKKEDAVSLLKEEIVYWCYYPTNRNIKNLFRNTMLAIKILIKERPNLILSTGAASAVPFFWIGKLLGAKTIFVEVYDRINQPTLTGKLVYPVSDLFLVQWDELTKYYPKAENIGKIY